MSSVCVLCVLVASSRCTVNVWVVTVRCGIRITGSVCVPPSIRRRCGGGPAVGVGCCAVGVAGLVGLRLLLLVLMSPVSDGIWFRSWRYVSHDMVYH